MLFWPVPDNALQSCKCFCLSVMCESYVNSDQGGVQENYYYSPGAEIPVQTGPVHTKAHCLDGDQGGYRGDQAEASPEQTESGQCAWLKFYWSTFLHGDDTVSHNTLSHMYSIVA